MKCSVLLSTLLVISLVHAQNYRSPVDIPIQLSGTFAELRGTHFHAGIDIRTQGKEGLPLRAIADGYVSRIKIQQGGYGKTIYINHPNGITSVYAHLQRYSPDIIPLVRKRQYSRKSYTIEFYTEPDQIPIKKGALIGYSGNTGLSFGPHLHFELRTSSNQIPFNPLLNNNNIPDTRKPIIVQLIGYPIDGIINKSEEQIQLAITQKNDSVYVSDTIKAIGTIGFGIEHFDRQNESFFKNGAFKINANIDNTPRFEIQFDTLSFDDSSQMHKLIDYPLYIDTKKKVVQLFNTHELPVTFANYTNNGLVDVEPGVYLTYTIKVSDVAGNSTYLRVPIEGKVEEVWITKKSPIPGKIIYPKRDYMFELQDFSISVNAKTFSQPTPLNIEMDGDTLNISNDYAYFEKPYNLILDKEKTPKGAYLALKQSKGWGFVAKKNDKGQFSAKLKGTGAITILTDSIPPTIVDQKKISDRWISLEKDIRFIIDDIGAGISHYEAYLNNKWILFEYEKKKKQLTFRFRDPIMLKKTKHKLKLIVWDKVGNSTTFETTFYRKE
ncbi:MAG: peptidase M23 [Flavobacteriaceae bacterium]|nr:peptidase M23 [Flavobacteriaceae bacterium]